MKTRNGFIYTLFALFILSTLLLAASFPLSFPTQQQAGERIRVDEVFFFAESMEDDFPRAAQIAGKRAFISAVNHVINTGQSLQDAESALLEAFSNGTIDGVQQSFMQGNSMAGWAGKINEQADDAGITVSSAMETGSVRMVEPFTAELNASFNVTVHDPKTTATFTETGLWTNRTINITNMEDPLILLNSEGRDTNFYQACSYPYHANLTVTGSNTSYTGVDTWVSGFAHIFPAPVTAADLSGVANKSGKIAVVADVCNAMDEDVTGMQAFAGVVSESAVTGATCTTEAATLNAYIDNAANARTVLDNQTMTVMNEDDVWINYLYHEAVDRCYFEDELNGSNQNLSAPTFLGRLENRYTISGDRLNQTPGIASFQPVDVLPPELQDDEDSVVDYVYWNDSNTGYGAASEIKGVTDRSETSWFLLDQVHIDEWEINDLVDTGIL